MSSTETRRDLEELWNLFLERRDSQARSQLAEHYLYLVKIALGRMIGRLPSYLDRGDLEQVGTIGLLQALDRFQPERGSRFETYALPRIRGSILDYLRSLDPLSRQERKRLKDLLRVWQKLEEERKQEPSLENLAQELEMSVEEVMWLIEREKSSFWLSLEEEKEQGESVEVRRLDRNALKPEEILENQELMEYLGRAIDELPERERLIIALYYFEGLTLKEIGKVLEIGESRVSQILARTITKLRVRLKEWEGKEDE